MSAGGLLLYDAKIISTRARADWLSREMLNVHFVRWKSVFYKRAVVATAAATSACRSNQELTIASEAGQYILFEIYGDAFFILGAYALRIYSSNQTHKLNCVCIEMRCEMCAQACIYLLIIICRIIAPPPDRLSSVNYYLIWRAVTKSLYTNTRRVYSASIF